MKTTRRHLLASGAALGGTLAMPAYLRAQSAPTEISVQYSNPVLFKELMENVVKAFMAKHPGITVTLRAPEQDYEAILQRNLRDAVTRNLPDVAFHGLNRQRTLEERGIPVDLRPLIDADPETKELGFSPTLLSLGDTGGKQTGIGFALSTPILYYNADLLKAAGADPDVLPKSWDEVIRLAAAIHSPAANRTGMFFDWTVTGNWSWQSLVFSHGGALLDPTETKVAFTEEPGRQSIRTLRRMVDEGRMPDFKSETAFQDMFAGRLGIFMNSTAQLGRFNREIGGRYRLVCGRFPLSSPAARLPAGGNVGMIFTRDAAKQKAGWEFLRFACGPIGATMMVNATGYMPGTTIPAQREDLLAKFYRDNPNHLVSIGQQDVIRSWYAFPGQNALKITDVINDHIQTVVAKRADAEPTLDSMAKAVGALLPRRAG
jgi:multiple sugar transport system substrate-binding protein